MSTPTAAATPAPVSLLACFAQLTDPRVDRTRAHRLLDILVIGICTLLCGGESFNDMEDFGAAKHEWFKTFLELPNGIPSHDTFNRVFSALHLDRLGALELGPWPGPVGSATAAT